MFCAGGLGLAVELTGIACPGFVFGVKAPGVHHQLCPGL